MPVGQAGVRHVGEEAELDRGICFPMWWLQAQNSFGWKEGSQGGKTFPGRKCFSSRGQASYSQGSAWFTEWSVCVLCTRLLNVPFHAWADFFP